MVLDRLRIIITPVPPCVAISILTILSSVWRWFVMALDHQNTTLDCVTGLFRLMNLFVWSCILSNTSFVFSNSCCYYTADASPLTVLCLFVWRNAQEDMFECLSWNANFLPSYLNIPCEVIFVLHTRLLCRDALNPRRPFPPSHLCRDVFNPWRPFPPSHLCRDVSNPWLPSHFSHSICVEMF